MNHGLLATVLPFKKAVEETPLLSTHQCDDIAFHLVLTWFGSMVQNGKLSAAMPILVKTLNNVLLPTLGNPTMPSCMEKFEISV